MENKVTFRNAERKDTGVILQFVKELAAYEDMSDDVICLLYTSDAADE